MTDFMDPIMPEALGGSKYVRRTYDDNTRYTETHPPKTVDGIFEAFQSFILSMSISGAQVEQPRADKESEFIGSDFRTYCRPTGTLLDFTSTNTQQKLGLSERLERTLAAMARCIVADIS